MASLRQNRIEQILQIPESTWIISPEDIRDMWLDYSDLQEVFGNIIEEKDPQGYVKCIARALLKFNSRLPMTMFTLADFPDSSLLLEMSLVEVLSVVERYHAANFITASSGGTVTPLHERFQVLQGIRRELEQSTVAAMTTLKQHLSNLQAWGSFDSYSMRGVYGLPGY